MPSPPAPAAPPAPHAPPPPPAHAPTTGGGQTAPARGLAGLLAAVEPARPDFDLHPNTDPATAALHDTAGGGASSADFDHDPATSATDGGNGKNGSQQGVIRTWLLALAKRHEQAGAARLKALDVKKARATALQVKEQRTTNRSEKFVGGNTSSGTNTQAKADKNTGSSTKNSASRSDGKNHHTKNHNGTFGRGGHGSSGGSGGGSGAGGRGSGNHTSSGGRGGKDTHGAKTNHSGHSGSGTGGGSKNASRTDGASGKSGGAGSSGKPGKDGKTTANTSNGTSGTGGKSTKTPTSTCGDSSGIDTKNKTRKDDKPKTTKTPDGTPGAAGKGGQGSASGPSGTLGGTGTDTAGKTGPQQQTKPGDPDKRIDLKKTPKTPGTNTPKDAAKTPTKSDPKGKQEPAADAAGKTATRPVIDTQPAREAGYRDGTRIGRVEAQIGAYRDGLRDGRTDVKEAAGREKARLDKARADRQQGPVIPPKPTQPPAVPPRPKDPPMTASSSDYQQQATPIQVKNINAQSIGLGDGAARPSISRGEVRTLRGFQKRLETKTDRMTRIAEATRTLQQHAVEQAAKVTQLRELASGVQGGEKLLTALSRLEEAANVQASKAALIHKRAARAAEACRVLNTNADTRYGGIYKAVVDSPETSPAEMAYYREMAHA